MAAARQWLVQITSNSNVWILAPFALASLTFPSPKSLILSLPLPFVRCFWPGPSLSLPRSDAVFLFQSNVPDLDPGSVQIPGLGCKVYERQVSHSLLESFLKPNLPQTLNPV